MCCAIVFGDPGFLFYIGMAASTLRPGDAWNVEIARNPVFRVAPGVDVGNL